MKKVSQKTKNKLYDFVKWSVLVVLPGISILYVALAQIWNLPYSQEVSGTIAAVCTFLGTIVGVSSVSYNKKINKTTKQ